MLFFLFCLNILIVSAFPFRSESLTLKRSRKQFKINHNHNSIDVEITKQAFVNAIKNTQDNLSPGADLETADEQSEAAYADLIKTSMDQRFI
jgi:hypothetical protein